MELLRVAMARECSGQGGKRVALLALLKRPAKAVQSASSAAGPDQVGSPAGSAAAPVHLDGVASSVVASVHLLWCSQVSYCSSLNTMMPMWQLGAGWGSE